MLNFLHDIKLGQLPAGQHCYLFNLPCTKPIDNGQKYASKEIKEELKNLETKRLSYHERLETLEPIYEKVMRSVRKIKFGVKALERFYNEPKPYKIFLKPNKFYTIDDLLEKDIKLLVMFDDMNRMNCSINEAMLLHCEELKVSYKYMLELEWDLGWLDYQMEVIMFNKRFLCECERKTRQPDDDARGTCKPINIDDNSSNQLVKASIEQSVLPVCEDIYTSGIQDPINEKETELYKELNGLANQRTDLSSPYDMNEKTATEFCQTHRAKFAAFIQQIGPLEAASRMAIDPNSYYNNE